MGAAAALSTGLLLLPGALAPCPAGLVQQGCTYGIQMDQPHAARSLPQCWHVGAPASFSRNAMVSCRLT